MVKSTMPNHMPRQPGRPRSEETRQAILAAGLKLLEEMDYAKITIERIALEARVGKQSIYRWWNSKADVLLEAFTDRALWQLPALEPSGHAVFDLENLLKLFFASVSDPSTGKILRCLIAESQLDAEFRVKLYDGQVSKRRSMIRNVLEAGIRSGEFRRDLDIEVVLDCIHGAFWYRLLSGTAAALDDAFAVSLVKTLHPVLAAR